MRKLSLFVALMAVAVGAMAFDSDIDREYHRIRHAYDYVDSVTIDFDHDYEHHVTLLRYDDIGLAIVLEYHGAHMTLTYFLKPGSKFEFAYPLEHVARMMVSTCNAGAPTRVFHSVAVR